LSASTLNEHPTSDLLTRQLEIRTCFSISEYDFESEALSRVIAKHAGLFKNGSLFMMNQEVRRGKPLPITLSLKVVVSEGGIDVTGTIDITSTT